VTHNDRYAHDYRRSSFYKMAAPLNTCTTIEQCDVRFLWAKKIWMQQRIATKKCCPYGQDIIIIFNLRSVAFKAYCAVWIRRSNFRHQASPCASPRESTQRRKVELWARNFREFCLNAELHVTFRDLLHIVKLRHGTGGFTSPPKEGVLRIFSP
jgi:hypothetical protein